MNEADTNAAQAAEDPSTSTPSTAAAVPAGDVIAEIAQRAADTVEAAPPATPADPAAVVTRPAERGPGGKFMPKADGSGVKRKAGRPKGSKTKKPGDDADAAQGGFFATGNPPPRPKLNLGETDGAAVTADVVPAGPHPKALEYGEAYATLLQSGVEFLAEESAPYKPGQAERIAEAVAKLIPAETAENLPGGVDVLALSIGYAGPHIRKPKAAEKVRAAVGVVVDGVAALWGKVTGRGRGT